MSTPKAGGTLRESYLRTVWKTHCEDVCDNYASMPAMCATSNCERCDADPARHCLRQILSQLLAKSTSPLALPVIAPTGITKALRDDATLHQPNWDSYGSVPLATPAMDAADLFHSRWQATPCSDGGVQLEVHSHGHDIELKFEAVALHR